MEPMEAFRPETRAWFERNFAAPTPAQEQRLARDRGRRARPHPGADRLGEDARGVPLGDRPLDGDAGTRPPPALRLAAQGTQLRRRAEPARPARRPPVGAAGCRPHGGHAAEGARGDASRAAGHPDHDARVALPAAHLARTRAAAQRRHADPRRGARGRRDEARRPSRALGRAARGARGAAAAADRALGDAAPARGDRAVRLGRPADRARRRGRREGARSRGRRPGRGHARAGGLARRGLRAALDLAVDLPGARRARPRAPLDDRLRQQPPPRRAARAAAQRAGGGGDRAGPPRLAGARAADADRGGPEGRPYPVPRRDLVARARHRHGRRRPRDPGRVAEVGRARPAADRPRRPLARRGLARADLPEVPRRPARVGGRRAADAGGPDRGDADPAQPARRPRPADRRHLRRRGGRGRRAARARAPRLSVRRPLARAARERPRHARGPLPVGRVRRAAAAHHLGSHRGRPPRAAGRAAARRHERGHDPRPRPLRRLHRRRTSRRAAWASSTRRWSTRRAPAR